MTKRPLTQAQSDALAKGRWISQAAWNYANELSQASGGTTPASFYRYAVSDLQRALTPEGEKPEADVLKKARKAWEYKEVFATPSNLPTLNYFDIKDTSRALFENSGGSNSFYAVEMPDDDLDMSGYQDWMGSYERYGMADLSATEAKNAAANSLKKYGWDTYDEALDLFYNAKARTGANAAGLSDQDLMRAEGLI